MARSDHGKWHRSRTFVRPAVAIVVYLCWSAHCAPGAGCHLAWSEGATYRGRRHPYAHRRVRHVPVGHRHVGGAVRVEHPDSADVTRIPADDELAQPVPAGGPRVEDVSEVVDMIEDEPATGD